MRKFSAHRIYPVSGPPVNFGIVETADDGTILNIRETGGKPVEEAGLEFYPGIIIPGMVNAHCHLEISHLKGKIPEHTGISGFVSSIQRIRHSPEEQILRAAAEADRIMYLNGVSAVGDISNNELTLEIKKKSRIRYHTFIEVFGFDEAAASQRYQHGLMLAGLFSAAGLPHSLSPHAPYSVGSKLWELLAGEGNLTNRISMHHSESPEERELLERGTGHLSEYFRKAGFDTGNLPGDAADAFALLGKYLPSSEWLLVHNTLMNEMPAMASAKPGLHWVLCPRSNRYIENRLPDINLFARSGGNICLGTDSLASNHSLSVFDEVITILDEFPEIPFEQVLTWATVNGARALGMEDELGTLDKGKKPGLVNLPIFDWSAGRPGSKCQPIRLI